MQVAGVSGFLNKISSFIEGFYHSVLPIYYFSNWQNIRPTLFMIYPIFTHAGNLTWVCPSYGGMPYTVNASEPAEPAKAPDPSPNLAGATLFPETASKDPETKPAT